MVPGEWFQSHMAAGEHYGLGIKSGLHVRYYASGQRRPKPE